MNISFILFYFQGMVKIEIDRVQEYRVSGDFDKSCFSDVVRMEYNWGGFKIEWEETN